ncbi:DUF4832 domain-containing protein [Phycicoccus duodecadis]|jgi:hypothetical protein|uniref:Uncharacterized protein DUF4832 n=1 Tax=Phycicoccus duodecadis TaxID=173053 RepID=A0A2N3YI81_9MICO|nr:DUF4832 domain-containing protein [Phycicoccus duodecadis]PKW26528.1 uncharacterized protein DUF4832 [Phycicoccus duodecadis]
MNRPLPVRLITALAAAATLATVVAVPASARPIPPERSTTTTTAPAQLAKSPANSTNSGRGLYRWSGAAADPSSWPAADVYYRDQVYWGRLEPSRGVYDFSMIDAGIASAEAQRGKFSFRVMAYCPGCWMNNRAGFPKVTPSYIPLQPGTDIPDWNSEAFQYEWAALFAELGRRYGADPRIGYVDVGGFGKFGEWGPAGTDITPTNAMRLIGAVADAFPTKHVLLSAVPMWTKRPDITGQALAAYSNLGLRNDCLGGTQIQYAPAPYDTVWKTRPFNTEWCTGGDPVLAAKQVKGYHLSTVGSANLRLTWETMTATQRAGYADAIASAGFRYSVTRASFTKLAPGTDFTATLTLANTGSAPTYDPWNVNVVVKDSTGYRVATLPFTANLTSVLPGSTAITRTLHLPTIANGQYSVSLEVLDPERYLDPMRLANAGRASDGSYPLATVSVGGGGWPMGAAPLVRRTWGTR